MYGIFRWGEDQKLYGWVEHSFSMAWNSQWVRAWEDPDDAQYHLDKINRNPGRVGEAFILRLTREKLPYEMEVDFSRRNQAILGNRTGYKSGSKWFIRNVPFKVGTREAEHAAV